jgi:hypothetical protein
VETGEKYELTTYIREKAREGEKHEMPPGERPNKWKGEARSLSIFCQLVVAKCFLP